jgi:hypothetical protein
LPYIGEHSTAIGATREQVWNALIAVLCSRLGGGAPTAIARPWGLEPAQRRGDWRSTPERGDSLPGFTAVRVQEPACLALAGRHRFSRYELVFELEADGAGCALRARSYAEFPGLKGRVYRALVIGSGGHRLAVRRLLSAVAARA